MCTWVLCSPIQPLVHPHMQSMERELMAVYFSVLLGALELRAICLPVTVVQWLLVNLSRMPQLSAQVSKSHAVIIDWLVFCQHIQLIQRFIPVYKIFLYRTLHTWWCETSEWTQHTNWSCRSVWQWRMGYCLWWFLESQWCKSCMHAAGTG